MFDESFPPQENSADAEALEALELPETGEKADTSLLRTLQRIAAFSCLPKHIEYIVSVDLTGLWRRHLVWSKKDGDDLLKIVVARYQSTTVFMSLLVSAEFGVFFSPSQVVEILRQSLSDPDEEFSLKYWTGIFLLLSIFVSISALVANFTAWQIFLVLGKQNAPIILRSSMGLYAAQLPNRLVMVSIYLLVVWVVLFFWVLLKPRTALLMTALGCLLVFHIVTTYSALARVIMATSAMGEIPILPKEEEEKLLPAQLFDVLMAETQIAKTANVPVNQQYRMNYQKYIRDEKLRTGSGPHGMTYKQLLGFRHPRLGLKSRKQQRFVDSR